MQTHELARRLLAEQTLPAPSGGEAARKLAEGIASLGIGRLPWTKPLEQWRARVQFLRRADPGFPDLSDEALAATAHRAKLQLRLQQTVEGLSLAAIVYYLAGLVGYGAKALKAAGLPLSPDLVTGLSVPLLALGTWWALHRVHRRLAADDPQSGSIC